MKTALRSVFLLVLLLPLELSAQARPQASEPTSLQLVIQSTREHYPQVLAAQRDIEKSQALLLASQGAFDPRVEGTLGTQQGGYYQHSNLDSGYVQAFPFMNSRVFGGYRLSDGDFASYEGKDRTLGNGEIRMGFALSLWRNREIDERRAAISTAELQIQVEQFRLGAEQIKLYEQAYVAYARWLLAHKLAEAYQGLLDVAVTRGQGLETSVAAGNAARILLVENRQAILQRQALVTDAKRQINVAAEQLALYLRDAEGHSVYPAYDPGLVLPAEPASLFTPPLEQSIVQALEKRPELAIARLAQQQSQVRKLAAENLAKPQVDVRVYTSRDFGSGIPTLAGTDNVVDLNFSIPLATREARGRAASAQAEIDGMQYRIRLLQDQLAQDIRAARVTLEATRTLETLAMDELKVTEDLVNAELLRFTSGQSDFFLLNQRERQVGEALLKRWQAHLAHQVALADYYAATMAIEAVASNQLSQ